MDRTQITRVSVADQVAALLRQRILEGEFRPGTQLQELPLASSLGVSRNTMREAIRILSLEGLLRRSLHRGAAVSQLSLRDVQEIYQLRRMLELPAVLAARSPDPGLLEEIRSAVEQFDFTVYCVIIRGLGLPREYTHSSVNAFPKFRQIYWLGVSTNLM